jgi:predicted ATPase
MLTRIYIDNFRCFVNFEYRPERKQLLLGANGSGKSSLLDVVVYLKQFLRGEEHEFTQSTRTRWQDRPVQVFEIEALLDKQKYEYRVEIRLDSGTKQLSVSQERLTVSGATVFELAKGEIHFFPNNSSQAATVPLETTTSALHLSLLSNSHVHRFVKWMKESVHCFRIDTFSTYREESADREEPEPDYALHNLAGWYRRSVQAHPDLNVRFLASMKEAIAGFRALRFSSDEGGIRKIRADFVGPRKAAVNYAISELSDGQWCLLALYMILHFLIARGDTVFIDEPDNYLSLREIQPWLLAAEEALEDHKGQLILVSHHPEILNQWAQTYGLHFFREKNGQVRTGKFKPDPGGNLPPAELIARGWEDE